MIHCAKIVDDLGEGPEVFWFVSLDGDAWIGVDREPKPYMREDVEALFATQKRWDTDLGREVEEGHIRISRRWLRLRAADFWTLAEGEGWRGGRSGPLTLPSP